MVSITAVTDLLLPRVHLSRSTSLIIQPPKKRRKNKEKPYMSGPRKKGLATAARAIILGLAN